MAGDELLRAELTRAARALGAPDDVTPLLERPRDPAFGDWATNLAMTLAKPLGKKPREFAQQIIDAHGPRARRRALRGDRRAGLHQLPCRHRHAGPRAPDPRPGRARVRPRSSAAGQPVNVEFVSANPTGPLHVGHGRQAALGDAISALLEATGWAVTREFYYNDAGAQIKNLAASVQARIAQLRGRTVEIPEGGYHGEYIREIAQRYVDAHPADPDGADLDAVRRFAVQELRARTGPRSAGVRREVRRLLPRIVALHRRQGRARPSIASSRPATRTRRTARSGSGPRTSATTRTA